jgi:hypothetical protein
MAARDYSSFDAPEPLGEDRVRKIFEEAETWLDPLVQEVRQQAGRKAPRWRCISSPP